MYTGINDKQFKVEIKKKKNILSQIISVLKRALGLEQKYLGPWTVFILQRSDYRSLGSHTFLFCNA